MILNKEELDIKKVIEWKCPSDTGVPLITMPNIPKPLHGLPPRTIMGKTAWDKMRKLCYYKANYKCEVCGCTPDKGRLHAHELYDINYLEGTSEFKRCIAICKEDHDFIHSGRLITLYKEGNPLYPKSYVLRVVEKGFKMISEYNKDLPEEEQLRVFETIVEYLRVTGIREEVFELIKKYNIKFYKKPKRGASWDKWKLVWRGKEYKSPYENPDQWREAMDKARENDVARIAAKAGTLSGGVFDEVMKILGNNANNA